MCIVQVNNGLGVSRAINIADNMIIYTDNKRVREARESVLEFLLINHPLDCPIRDQAGECDLQDISLVFGSDRGRFYEKKKRAVDNFNQKGPLIKTMMTRCIHRTRCVRFSNEISDFMLGVISRGLKMEIGTYISEYNENTNLLDVLSGNIVDLCPVGALTSMPYAFKIRNWEIIYYSNIDFLDSLASSIRLHIYSNKIIRILPLLDEAINEEWITNKARFSYDALLLNRINYPKIKYMKKFLIFSWDFSVKYILKWIQRKNKFIYGILGAFIDIITSLSLKNFFSIIGISSIITYVKSKWIYDFKFFYLINNRLENLEILNFFLFISCDLRLENPLLNIRIKKNYNLNKNNELFLFSYGLALNYLSYPIKNLGNSIIKFLNFLKGKIRTFSNIFFKSFLSFSFTNSLKKLYNKPIFFLGNSILNREDSCSFLYSFIFFLKKKFSWNAFNLVINNLGLLSYYTIIYNNLIYKKKTEQVNGLLYNISNDISYFNFINKFAFVIYQGFFKSNTQIYVRADIVLPSTAPYEMDGLFINLEGRYRFMKQHIKNSLAIYADWDIINLLRIYNKKKNILKFFFFKYNLIICYFYKVINYTCNFFLTLEDFFINFFFYYGYKKKIIKKNNYITLFPLLYHYFVNKFLNTVFNRYINNYYSNDYFLKNSKIMSFCAIKTYNKF